MVLTNRSAWGFKFGDRGGSFADFTPLAASVPRNSTVNSGSRRVNQVSLPGQEPVPIITEIPGYLTHPDPIRLGCDTRDFHAPCREVEQKEHQKPRQARPRPHLDGEEIRRHHHLPVPAQELFPCRLSVALRRGFQAVLLENVSDGAPCHLVAQIGKGTLDPPIVPIRFSVARRTAKSSILSRVRGRPGPRFLLPSYFWAISFRCQASNVSGATIVATSARIFRPKPLALVAKRRRWLSSSRSRRPPSCSRSTRFSSRR